MSNGCCAARGHALAVFNLLAPPPSLRSGAARSKNSLRAAQQTKKITSLIDFYILKKIKKTGHKQNL